MAANDSVEFINLLVSDKTFRERFEANRETVLQEAKLSENVRVALSTMDIDQLIGAIEKEGQEHLGLQILEGRTDIFPGYKAPE